MQPTEVASPSSEDIFLRVTRLVRRYLGPANDHEDIAIGIILESWENNVRFPSVSFVRFRCYDILRSRAREEALLRGIAKSDVLDDSSSLESTEHRVENLILLLDPLERKLVWYRFYQGLPADEIAKVLRVSRETVRETLARALTKMRQEALDE